MFKIKNIEIQIDSLLQHIFLMLFMLFCIVFYRERILIYDTSYYLYNIIQNEAFFTPHGRYGAAITQFLPLLSVKLDLSLPIVMKAFSINVFLYYYVLFLLIRYKLKDLVGAWLFIFSFAFFAVSTHFYIVSEVQIGLSLAVFIVLWVYHQIVGEHKTNSSVFYIVLFLLFLSIGWLHFFIYIPLGIMLGYLVIVYGKRHTKTLGITIGLFLINFSFHYLYIRLQGGYQSEKILGIKDIMETLNVLQNGVEIGRKQWIARLMPLEFYIPKICAGIILLAILLYKRKFLLLGFSLLSLIGMSIMLLSSIPEGYPLPYKESFANVWGIILITPLFFVERDWGKEWQKSSIFIGIFCVSILYTSLYKCETVKFYTERLTIMDSIIQNMHSQGISKGYFFNTNMPYVSGWESPYESLLYSGIKPPCITYLVITGTPDSILLNQKNIFIGAPWELSLKIKDLSSQYFYLDTTSVYRALK